MLTLESVIAHVFGDRSSGCLHTFIAGHFHLQLESSKTGFHEGVVVAVVGAAHALPYAGPHERGPIPRACVLAAAVGVMYQARLRLLQADRLRCSRDSARDWQQIQVR